MQMLVISDKIITLAFPLDWFIREAMQNSRDGINWIERFNFLTPHCIRLFMVRVRIWNWCRLRRCKSMVLSFPKRATISFLYGSKSLESPTLSAAHRHLTTPHEFNGSCMAYSFLNQSRGRRNIAVFTPDKAGYKLKRNMYSWTRYWEALEIISVLGLCCVSCQGPGGLIDEEVNESLCKNKEKRTAIS